MNGDILVLGATGTTGSRVADGLRERGASVRAASRTDADMVRFDWLDRSSWPGALDGVQAMYLIGPGDAPDPASLVGDFLRDARAAGVKRTVLLSSSALEPAAAGPGAWPALVRAAMPQWAILRPSWFMSNVLGQTPLAAGLHTGQVFTATGHGKVAFIDPDDIAAVAVYALLADRSPNKDLLLTGPTAHSYADLCAMVADVTGRSIEHTSMSTQAYTEHLITMGIPPSFAPLLASLDEPISCGSEDRVTDTVAQVLGRAPGSLNDFLTAHVQELRG